MSSSLSTEQPRISELALIRFGILYDGGMLQSWQLDALEHLLALKSAHAISLIVARDAGAAEDATGHRPLPECLGGLPIVTLTPDSEGTERAESSASTASRSSTLARVADYKLDFVLSFLGDSCPSELLKIPRYGVWRYHFGDWFHHRGGPVGFWEVYEGRSVSSALLLRQQQEASAAIILREGHLRTDLLSCAKNKRQLLTRFAHWPAQVCTDIRHGATDRLTGPVVRTAAPVRELPNRWQTLNCRLHTLVRAARTALRSLLRHDQWNIAVVDQPIASFLHSRPTSVRWLAPTKRSELRADPFAFVHGGQQRILCEHFSYHDNRGYIVALNPDEDAAATRVDIGPQPPVHMSYPYLLYEQGRLLCLPESSEAKEVACYELQRFPDRWVRVATLLRSEAIVDATVFRHGEYWWLAGSEVAPKGANCELHLWYAQAVSGPWHAHPGNPVKIDVRSSRPGGTPFLHDGVLYRPAQDCSNTYGARVIINRVHTLTPIAFHEESVATLAPDPNGPYPDGLHTLSQFGDLTLIDGKRRIFVPAEFRRVLMKTLRSISRIP
jgi:hypothetical protein